MASGPAHTPTPVLKQVSKLPFKSNEQGAEEQFARLNQIHEHSLVFICPFLLSAATTSPSAAQSGLYILRSVTVLESEGLERPSGWQ